jgi:hypothetical protein
LRRIPPDASLHDKRKRLNKMPWNPNIPLARTITTHGGYGNYHPSGKRDFTLREYAIMNGFPARYEFFETNAKTQIGNAFPPNVVKVLFDHLRKWLEDEDRVHPVEEQAVTLEEPEYDIVELLSDDEDDDDRKWEGIDNDNKDGAPLFCIDPTQKRTSIIDLTTESASEHGVIIDLTIEPNGPTPGY